MAASHEEAKSATVFLYASLAERRKAGMCIARVPQDVLSPLSIMAIFTRDHLVLLVVAAASLVPALIKFANGEAPNDVVAFMATSRLIHEHAGTALYMQAQVSAAQGQLGTMGGGWMPWAYPPFASLLAALYPTGRAALPAVIVGQGLVMLGLTMAAARTVPDPKAFLTVSSPLVAIANLSGQPAFILVLMAYLLVLRFGPCVGIGWLAVIKPHLAAGPAFALLCELGWRKSLLFLLVVSAVSLGGLFALSALAGAHPLEMMLAWRQASARMLEYVSAVGFPLPRFVSPYALSRTLGVPHVIAIALAGCVGVLVLGLIWRASAERRRALGFAGALLLTPYIYDYDAGVLLIALALASRQAGHDLINRYGIAVMFNAVSGYLCLFGLPHLGVTAPFNPAPALTLWVFFGLSGLLAQPAAGQARGRP